ncbi:MAG: hypothetical protein V4735_05665 [Pseudomonadota bacterium]
MPATDKLLAAGLAAQWAADTGSEGAAGTISKDAVKERLYQAHNQLKELTPYYNAPIPSSDKSEIATMIRIIDAAQKSGELSKNHIETLSAYAKNNEAAYGQAVTACVRQKTTSPGK